MSDNGSAEALGSYRDRLARMKKEKRELAEEERELRKEIKNAGFDPVALAELVNEAELSADASAKRRERLENKRLYARELGVTPIEDWIERQAEAEAPAPASSE